MLINTTDHKSGDRKMSTVNGGGKMHYDWRWEDDRTASATLWIVVFFLPIYPLRREHVRVVGHGIRPGGFWETLMAFLGAGSGFHTTLETLGVMPMNWPGVYRTYLLGWIAVPFLAFIGPILLVTACVRWLPRFGMDFNQLPKWAVAVLGWGILMWVGVIVAKILDRASGRQHVDPVVIAEEQGRRHPKRQAVKKRSL